jgi:hypothetical protein
MLRKTKNGTLVSVHFLTFISLRLHILTYFFSIFYFLPFYSSLCSCVFVYISLLLSSIRKIKKCEKIISKWPIGNKASCLSMFHRAFQFTFCNGPTNALVCNKTLIQMSYTKILKITPTFFDHQLIIIRELFGPS